jgi:hypothetical protein
VNNYLKLNEIRPITAPNIIAGAKGIDFLFDINAQTPPIIQATSIDITS